MSVTATDDDAAIVSTTRFRVEHATVAGVAVFMKGGEEAITEAVEPVEFTEPDLYEFTLRLSFPLAASGLGQKQAQGAAAASVLVP